MIINDASKRVIPFRPGDAKRVGEGCYYLDMIVWLNSHAIEMGDGVGFNIGVYVNGYGGLVIGNGSRFGPYSMIHTANHVADDPDRPIWEQGWNKEPVLVGEECWIGMGVCILPGVSIGSGSIIGAGSVVTKDIPAYAVAVGNPCRVIRNRRAGEQGTP